MYINNTLQEIQARHSLLDSELAILMEAAENGLDVEDVYYELRDAAAAHYGSENLEDLWADSYDDYQFALVEIKALNK